MALFARAGQLALASDLINVPLLVSHYYQITPDLEDPTQKVIFGTSGHRGCATLGSFNEAHILAIAQAIAEVRKANGVTGPCFIGKDSHALSEPALLSVLEVFIANQIDCCIAENQELTPTPAVSYAILQHNIANPLQHADGIVLTPSHNPPRDGGIKYNPPNGGPADTDITKKIEARANALLVDGLKEVKRSSLKSTLASNYLHFHDFITPYVDDLQSIVDLPLIRNAKLKLAVDPLGGAGVSYWERIAESYKLDLTVVNKQIDPSFRFMTLDHDGEIRMDCSSPYAMAGLLNLRNQYDLAFANDADHDRHGIVTPEGLMNPNHFLAVSIDYLFKNRSQWNKNITIGKTLVSSAMIDRVAHSLKRTLIEVPVGFKWFVDGLYNGELGFVGEESAGASFLRFNGKTWTTDKDGIIMCLLAAEIQAKSHINPQQYYSSLAEKLGSPSYLRIQEPATFEQKKRLSLLSADNFTQTTLAGDNIIQILTKAPGNQAPIGGVKVVTENGWFTARPSGTENAYKIYCESFLGEDHLQEIALEATKMVNTILQ